MSGTNVTSTTTEKKDSPAIDALKSLGSYKLELDSKLKEFEEKVNTMTSREPIGANKENSLKGISYIKDFLSDFKSKRIEKTNVFTAIVKVFTEGEAKILELQNKLQLFADKCLQHEKMETQKHQAEIQAQKNRDAEIVSYKIKAKEKVMLDLSNAKSEVLQSILSINDSEENKTSIDVFKKELSAIPLKIKTSAPEFVWTHNSTISKNMIDTFFAGVVQELQSEINEAKMHLQQLVNDALNQAQDLFEMFTTNKEAAKQQIEANNILQQSKIDVEVQQVQTSAALQEQVNVISTLTTEVVFESSTIINLKIDSHQGLLNLITWWLSSKSFFELTEKDFESVTVSKMLTAAKKKYKDEPNFKLEGVTKSTTEKAK